MKDIVTVVKKASMNSRILEAIRSHLIFAWNELNATSFTLSNGFREIVNLKVNSLKLVTDHLHDRISFYLAIFIVYHKTEWDTYALKWNIKFVLTLHDRMCRPFLALKTYRTHVLPESMTSKIARWNMQLSSTVPAKSRIWKDLQDSLRT